MLQMIKCRGLDFGTTKFGWVASRCLSAYHPGLGVEAAYTVEHM